MDIQDRPVVTAADRQQLRQMIDGLRASLPANGEPYGSYLRALEQRLARMATVMEEEVGDDVVTMNSTVSLLEVTSGRRQRLRLAYEPDSNGAGDPISVLTPVGAAMLGSRVGEVVEWQTRRGPRRLQVERIEFQPESAGRTSRALKPGSV